MRTNFFERILAGVFLVLSLPIFALLWILVKLEDGGPLLFKQKRLGKNRIPFLIYKVRTMVVGAEKLQRKYKGLNEADTPVFKIYNDPRYTRLGKFLAHTGLDELPQLINIVKGEMKFIGPRPLPVYEAVKVPKRYSLRFSVLPGVTSLWIVKGAHSLSFEEWMELDMKQIKDGKFGLELSIITKTAFLVLGSLLSKARKHLLWGALASVLLLGSLGSPSPWVMILEGAGIIFVTILTLTSKSKTSFPPGVLPFLIFLGILAWEVLTRSDSQAGYETLFLYTGGLVLWLAAFNFKGEFREKFPSILVFVGLILAGLYVVWSLSGAESILPQSLYTATSAFRNHNHIGDLWALVLLVPLYRLIRKPNRIAILLTVLGISLLIFSLSRSAVVSLLVGISYLFVKGGFLNKKRAIYLFVVGALLVVFILISAGKTTLASRPYFTQAVAGLSRHPWGVGIGNFKTVSFSFNPETFSYSAHNLFLETLVEFGWPGMVLALWAIYSVFKILGEKSEEGLISRAVFLALTVNFFFDSTYKIPTMIWIWFLSLGLSRGKRHPR